MTAFRVSNRGRIDRDHPIRFRFDGTEYEGFRGDTIASALLSNGVHLIGRSFKYHRPRGIFSAGSEEPNAMVHVDRGMNRAEPNVRATVQEIFEGLESRSQNRWPSLNYDIGALNDLASGLLPAGFYYKTFMWPRSFWDNVYEPLIRAAAGHGRAPETADPEQYAPRYVHCDVLVVGAGPAGLAAATAAAEQGARVIVADEQAEMGGWLLSAPAASIEDLPAWEWLASVLGELAAKPNVTLLSRTTAIGHYHDNFVVLSQRLTDHLGEVPTALPRERLLRVRAKQVILAQGAIERPIAFSGNDRPGVMLAGAAGSYLNRYGVRVGDRVAVFTSDDSAYAVALDLAAAGSQVVAIIDPRDSGDAALVDTARAAGIDVLDGWTVTATSGRHRIRRLRAAPQNGGAGRTITCDALLMCGGWTPSVHLFSHARGELAWRGDMGAFVPGKGRDGISSVGATAGTMRLAPALSEGSASGAAAADDAGQTGAARTYRATEPAVAGSPLLKTARAGRRSFVDFQHDVTVDDIDLAVREGFRSIEHVKRYTTTGMATDQGKTSNINAVSIAAESLGQDITATGLTTFRPPFAPTTFAALAGHSRGATFDVERRTPIDGWAEAQGAVFEPVSQWRRARYFPRGDEDMSAAVGRECEAARSSVGIFDGSTLGKIEVVGPDAAEFLNRVYTNPLLKLPAGRCRYGILLGEDGFIRDDGVIGRLADDRFHVTTTTGGAPSVLATMEDYLQTEWPDLRVWLTSVTEQWAVIALNGPRARDVVQPLVEDIDLSPGSFPHMAVREGRVLGVGARLFRVSFTGELGFEINVPSRYGRAVWDEIIDAGKRYAMCPYGTEAMHVLRAEKGYIIVGQDTDGTVTPADAGLSWAIGKTKKDFIGMRSLSRPDMLEPGRKQLVGLLTEDPQVVLEEGAQIVNEPGAAIPMPMIGHVTSSYYSRALKRSVALALVADGRRRQGDVVHIPMPGQTHAAEVSGTVFYDSEGERLNV